MNVTIATHNGSKVSREHNRRNERVVRRETHIDPAGHHETWVDISPRQAYHQLFDNAVAEYNAKQKRADRKIGNYYSLVERDAKKHPVYEMVIGVYPKDGDVPDETKREILKAFVDDWKERNPNLFLCGAYYHADEEGEPHVHIDYIPVGTGYQKGMSVQSSLTKALENMGYQKEGKLTAQMQWEASENAALESYCNVFGLTVIHPEKEKRSHVATSEYKAQKDLEATLEEVKTLKTDLERLKGEYEALKAKYKGMNVEKELELYKEFMQTHQLGKASLSFVFAKWRRELEEKRAVARSIEADYERDEW